MRTLTIVSTFPLALLTWCWGTCATPESSLTPGRQRSRVRFPASLAITSGCAVTRFRDQWSAVSAGRRRAREEPHTTQKLYCGVLCAGSSEAAQGSGGAGGLSTWQLRRQQHSFPGFPGDGQMGSGHREQAGAWGWAPGERQSGSPCFRSLGEGCGHCNSCAGSWSAAVWRCPPLLNASSSLHSPKLVCASLLPTFPLTTSHER